jgi:hypothetical protein
MPLRIVAKHPQRQARRGQFRTTKKHVPNVAKSAQHPHSKLKTQKELKKITDSSSYKKADYKGKTEMLGGKVYAKGGRAHLVRKAGPAAPSRPRKLTGDAPLIKWLAGGVKGKPHSSKEGREAAAGRKFSRIVKRTGKPKKDKRPPLRKGGSAKKPRPHGPHMWVRGDKRKRYAEGGSVGAAVRGRGCEIK